MQETSVTTPLTVRMGLLVSKTSVDQSQTLAMPHPNAQKEPIAMVQIAFQ